jgi:hypothetical protein
MMLACKPLRLCCLAAVLGLSAPVHADELGRLFFTPAERAAMNRSKAGAAPQIEETVPPTPPRVNGIVTRSDGHRTVWIGGKPRYDAGTGATINPGSVDTAPGIRISRNVADPHTK